MLPVSYFSVWSLSGHRMYIYSLKNLILHETLNNTAKQTLNVSSAVNEDKASCCMKSAGSLTSHSGLFWWERLHLQGSRKLLRSRLIHSGLNGTSTTMDVINVRRANKEQIRTFLRINKPALPSRLP